MRARDDRIAELESRLDLVIEELARVRKDVVVPEEPELASLYGYGPAASKVFGLERGLSIGGYGEGNYTTYVGDKDSTDLDRADLLRLVLYVGYKFTDRIVFNSEIEFEHATTEDVHNGEEGGSVSVELATLDFFFKPWLNFRTGLLLVPMGFTNEVHEPPFFFGVKRPEVEQRIIPTTWRENGVGIFGKLGESLEYRAYAVNGFNASQFSDSGIRDGRQSGSQALAEDFGFVARLDWTPDCLPGVLLGGSGYLGDTGQDFVDDVDARLLMLEGHAQVRRGPFQARVLFAWSQLSDAADLNRALARPTDEPIADAMLGGYVELAYDVWPWLFGNEEKSLTPFFRVEYVDSQYGVPPGYAPNRNDAYWLYTPGLSFYPHPNVVVKLEYRNFHALAGTRPDEVGLGVGFAF